MRRILANGGTLLNSEDAREGARSFGPSVVAHGDECAVANEREKRPLRELGKNRARGCVCRQAANVKGSVDCGWGLSGGTCRGAEHDVELRVVSAHAGQNLHMGGAKTCVGGLPKEARERLLRHILRLRTGLRGSSSCSSEQDFRHRNPALMRSGLIFNRVGEGR
jgi:hypothetical protein